MRSSGARFVGAVVLAFGLSVSVTGIAEAVEKNPVDFDVSQGLSYWSGDVTYTIGGRAWDDLEGEWFSIEDPLSELVFPLDVFAVSVQANLTFMEMFELYGGSCVALEDPDEKVEDSDWYRGVKIIYSESDSEITSEQITGSIGVGFEI